MNTESGAAKTGTSRPPLRRLTSVRHVSGTGPHPSTSPVHLAGVDPVAMTSPDELPLRFKNRPVIVLTVVIVCNLRPSRSENAARTVCRPQAHAGTKDTNSPVAGLFWGRSVRALDSALPEDRRRRTAISNADPAAIPRIVERAGGPEARERDDRRISITNSTVASEPCHELEPSELISTRLTVPSGTVLRVRMIRPPEVPISRRVPVGRDAA
jgi:hypothetical protein